MGTRPELPEGTVTFLFTDIEGSTRLLRLWRDDYAGALADHQRILREVFAERSGHEIDTQGDSFFVAFRRARDAVAAAAECQRRLAGHQWPEGGVLRVRMGIHTGEPSAAGERYVGLGVHRAARICAAGHGGQVLVSQTTRELLRDDPVPGVSLRDLGDHQLKDMDGEERLYQLVAPGLDETFAPLNTANKAPFGGQEQQLAAATLTELARPRRRDPRVLGVAAALAVGAVVLLTTGIVLIRRGDSTANVKSTANTLSIVNTSTGDVSAAVPTGSAPGSVAFGAGAVWVADAGANVVLRIDPASHTVQQRIQVNSPAGIAFGGGSVWVTTGKTLVRINPGSNLVTDTVKVGNGPVGVTYGGGAVWVANSFDGTVTKLVPGTGKVSTLHAIPGISALAYGFGRLWGVSPPAGAAVAIDPGSGAVGRQILVGVDPEAIATGAGYVWVANRGSDTVSQIEPGGNNPITNTANVDAAPTALAVVGRSVWVANSQAGTLSRIVPGQSGVAHTVNLANPPAGLAADGTSLYATVQARTSSHRGGTLRADIQDPDFLDPARAYQADSWAILAMTNDGLLGLRRVGGIQGTQLVPDLAENIPQPNDHGLIYTFTLRPGVRYSNGQPLEPEDFRRAIERTLFLDQNVPITADYLDIEGAGRCVKKACSLSKGIQINRSHRTITFHLTKPDGDFLYKLAMSPAYAVPADTPMKLGRQLIPATGPYMIGSHRESRETPNGRVTLGLVTLVRNPRFRAWSDDAQPDGYPDRILFRTRPFGPTTVPAVNAVKDGRADVAADLNSPPLPGSELRGLTSNFPSQVRIDPSLASNFFFLNTNQPPFDSLLARKAVNYAFKRNTFAASLGTTFTPNCSVLPPDFPAYTAACPYGNGEGYQAPIRARKLVQRSGTSGANVAVWAPVPRSVEAAFIVQELDSLGYHAHVKAANPETYFDDVDDSRTRAQIGFLAWAPDFPSPGGFLLPLFSCDAFKKRNGNISSNPSELCKPKVNAALNRASITQSLHPIDAPAAWRAAYAAIMQEAPVIPTYNKQDVTFLARRVGNFQLNPQLGVLYDQLWVR